MSDRPVQFALATSERPEYEKADLRPRLEQLSNRLCQTQGLIIGALEKAGLTVVRLAATPPPVPAETPNERFYAAEFLRRWALKTDDDGRRALLANLAYAVAHGQHVDAVINGEVGPARPNVPSSTQLHGGDGPAAGPAETPRPENCWGPQWCDNSPCTCRGPKQRVAAPAEAGDVVERVLAVECPIYVGTSTHSPAGRPCGGLENEPFFHADRIRASRRGGGEAK